MSNQKKIDHRWFLWFGLGVVAVGALVAFLTPASFAPGSSLAGKRITVSVDTNGTTWLGGAPLPTAKIRNAAFSALGTVGVKANFSLPPAYVNGTGASKAADTLASMYRAGLLTTNQTPKP